VDYAAALDRLSGEGVTPENNAAVLLLPAFGPALLKDRPDAALVPARIGARLLAAGGEEFVTMGDYLERLPRTGPDGKASSIGEMLRDTVRNVPWSDREHPLAAGWLRANERALARIVEASTRPRYWLPLREGGDLWGQAPSGPLRRDAAIALSSRAMRKLGSNDVMRAWDDLEAGARLASLIAQSPLVWEWLNAAHILTVVNEAMGAFATHATLTPEQARTVLADLQSLPRPPGAAETADRVGRADVLAGLVAVILNDNDPEGWKLLEVPPPVAAHADWDAVLGAINRWFDRLVTAGRKKDTDERRRAVAAWIADLDAAKARAKTVLQAAALEASVGTARGPRAPQVSETLAVTLGQLDSTARLFYVEDFAEAWRRVDQVALALAAYRSEKGNFPASLSALVPGCLKALPGDPYGPRPLVYARKDAGYLLYSTGSNGKPDQAAGAKYGDDILLRVE
jgi:hypothetical protein